MSKNNKIIKFFIFILILDLSLSDNRHENFDLTSNCNKKGVMDDTNVNNYFYKVTNLVDRCYEYSKCYILSRTGMERMIQYFENALLPIESYFNIAYNDLFYNDLKYGLINYYIFKHKNIII